MFKLQNLKRVFY